MTKTALLALALVTSSIGSAAAQPGMFPGVPTAASPSGVAGSEVLPDDAETPELSGGRLAGELLVGGLVGAGGGIAGAYLGASLELSGGCDGEFCGLGGAILGGLTGIVVGTTAGVYMAGSSGDQTGSLGATFLGSVLGTGLGIGLLASESEVGAVLGAAAPIVGAMIGFNATRRYDPGARRQRSWAPTASANGQQTTFGVVGRF